MTSSAFGVTAPQSCVFERIAPASSASVPLSSVFERLCYLSLCSDEVLPHCSIVTCTWVSLPSVILIPSPSPTVLYIWNDQLERGGDPHCGSAAFVTDFICPPGTLAHPQELSHGLPGPNSPPGNRLPRPWQGVLCISKHFGDGCYSPNPSWHVTNWKFPKGACGAHLQPRPLPAPDPGTADGPRALPIPPPHIYSPDLHSPGPQRLVAQYVAREGGSGVGHRQEWNPGSPSPSPHRKLQECSRRGCSCPPG